MQIHYDDDRMEIELPELGSLLLTFRGRTFGLHVSVDESCGDIVVNCENQDHQGREGEVWRGAGSADSASPPEPLQYMTATMPEDLRRMEDAPRDGTKIAMVIRHTFSADFYSGRWNFNMGDQYWTLDFAPEVRHHDISFVGWLPVDNSPLAARNRAR